MMSYLIQAFMEWSALSRQQEQSMLFQIYGAPMILRPPSLWTLSTITMQMDGMIPQLP